MNTSIQIVFVLTDTIAELIHSLRNHSPHLAFILDALILRFLDKLALKGSNQCRKVSTQCHAGSGIGTTSTSHWRKSPNLKGQSLSYSQPAPQPSAFRICLMLMHSLSFSPSSENPRIIFALHYAVEPANHLIWQIQKLRG